MRHDEHVVSRWVTDTAALGLGTIDPDEARRVIERLGLGRFGDEGEGIVRLEARAGEEGMLWIGATREVGPEPRVWRAGFAEEHHPGPRDDVGAKRADRAVLDRAKALAVARGWDETLLLDAEGFAVDGSRANLIVALPTGRLVTPPLGRGAVRGVARSILIEALPELEEADLAGEALSQADELIAVNSVRGARAIVSLGERPIGDGTIGPWAAQLSLLLDAHA